MYGLLHASLDFETSRKKKKIGDEVQFINSHSFHQKKKIIYMEIRKKTEEEEEELKFIISTHSLNPTQQFIHKEKRWHVSITLQDLQSSCQGPINNVSMDF